MISEEKTIIRFKSEKKKKKKKKNFFRLNYFFFANKDCDYVSFIDEIY